MINSDAESQKDCLEMTEQGAVGKIWNTGSCRRQCNRKFCKNKRKNFITVRVTEHWNGLPRGVVEFPPWETSQLPGRFSVPPAVGSCFSRGSWTEGSSEVPTKSCNSVILWRLCSLTSKTIYRRLDLKNERF